MEDTPPVTFLVFGDLHGRVLPAFRFGSYWSRHHRRLLTGLLQVGDLGYFPDVATMDKATLRHAKDDPLELGTLDIVTPNPLADRVFKEDPHCPPGLWFTAGNHEDFGELERLARASGDQPDFVVDAYCRVWGIKDGEVKAFDCGLQVAAGWGVDGDGPNCRQKLPPRAYIRERAVSQLLDAEFEVLLTHDCPADALHAGLGSELLLALDQPAFHFFGHYRGDGAQIEWPRSRTALFHLAGFELRTRDGHPESGGVGVLEQTETGWAFDFVPDDELKPFTRHNWKWI